MAGPRSGFMQAGAVESALAPAAAAAVPPGPRMPQ